MRGAGFAAGAGGSGSGTSSAMMIASRTKLHPGAKMIAPHATACTSSDAAIGSILSVNSRSVNDICALARLPRLGDERSPRGEHRRRHDRTKRG